MGAKRVVLLNGSVRGSEGNTAALLEVASRSLPVGTSADLVHLADYTATVEALAERLAAADALLFGSGVYWSSWGSPLQRFLEVMTGLEGSSCFLGKPAGVLITMDSVGGYDVAQRLVGVLSTLGCIIPPLSTVVVSRIGVLVRDMPGNEDVWQPEDVRTLVHNVLLAAGGPALPWASWPTLPVNLPRGPYPAAGLIREGLDRYLGGAGSEAGTDSG